MHGISLSFSLMTQAQRIPGMLCSAKIYAKIIWMSMKISQSWKYVVNV